MIFERNDAVVDIVWKRISPDFSFRSCLFVAALQWTHADVPILYENTHWLQWRMKIASIFVESNFQIRSAFLWPSLSRCDEVMRNTYLFSASIFTFIGGSPKKPSDALSLCWRSPSSSQWRNCDEGNLKNTKTFLVFLFVNFIYKLPHNSRARLHTDAHSSQQVNRAQRICASSETFSSESLCTASEYICECENTLSLTISFDFFILGSLLCARTLAFLRAQLGEICERDCAMLSLTRFKSVRVTWKIECETFSYKLQRISSTMNYAKVSECRRMETTHRPLQIMQKSFEHRTRARPLIHKQQQIEMK